MAVADSKMDLAERWPDRVAPDLERRLDQLPHGHPSSPQYVDLDRAESPRDTKPRDSRERHEADRVRPLTDAEHAQHVADVKVRLGHAVDAGLATNRHYTTDARRRVWTDERNAVHDSIIADMYAAAADVPSERRAIVAGGLSGAGKTTVLTSHAGIDLSRYLMINPDGIKQQMASRGLVPLVEGLSPMEASDLVHEEASHIAKRFARRAHADGKNVIWDITMSTDASAGERIDFLRGAGYSRIEGLFVDVPVEVSVRRTDARHRNDHDAYRAGNGMGGRCVPAEVILSQADEIWGNKNRANFESVKDRFDSWALYDNSVDDRAAVLVAVGGRLWRRQDDG